VEDIVSFIGSLLLPFTIGAYASYPAACGRRIANHWKSRISPVVTFLLLTLVAFLLQPLQADAQYLFNEQIGNHNPMTVGMVPGIARSTYDSTTAVVAADFNGDGRKDISGHMATAGVDSVFAY